MSVYVKNFTSIQCACSRLIWSVIHVMAGLYKYMYCPRQSTPTSKELEVGGVAKARKQMLLLKKSWENGEMDWEKVKGL